MSVSVSSFEVFVSCIEPTMSSPGTSSNRCVCEGNATTGAGGGGGGGGGSFARCWKIEQPTTRVQKAAAAVARSAMGTDIMVFGLWHAKEARADWAIHRRPGGDQGS